MEGRPAQRALTEGEQLSAFVEKQGEEATRRSHKEQKEPGTEMGPRQCCFHWQGQGPARGAWTNPPGPATAPIQVPPRTPREGREEDPEEPAQEQGKEETRGNSTGEVLEGLRRK